MITTTSTINTDLFHALQTALIRDEGIDDSILDSEYLIEKNPIRVEKTITNLATSNNTERLSNLFVYRDYWKIKNYLKIYPQLRDLLFETFYQFTEVKEGKRTYFGENTQFILELVPDIYEPNYEQLFIRIVSEQNIIENLNILDKFENDWWFEKTAHFINSPVITLE